MTSMADCLSRAIDFGQMDRARGIALRGDYDQLVARYAAQYAPAQAQALAARDLREANRAATARRRHVVLNQMRAMRRIRHLIDTSPDPAIALRNLLEYSDGSGFRGESVRSLAEAYEASIRAGLREVLERTGLNVIGNSRDPKLLEDLVRELHGEATGSALARQLADSVRGQQQRLRRLFNGHGGDIGDLADYGLPHAHDAARLQQRGFDAWAGDILPRLAWDRITDHRTGRPFAPAGQTPPMADVRDFLRDIHDGITTRGWDDRDPAMTVGGRAMANRRAEHRVLHFRSGSDWIDYNATYGVGDPFTAMMSGLNGLARDVAMMRVLGPNPRMGLVYAEQVAMRRAADLRDAGLADRVRTIASRTRAMLAHQDGTANVAEHLASARFLSGTRSVLVGVQLGSAVVSSVTDAGTIAAAARTIGMNPANVMSRTVQLTASQATRATAARMGYVAETLADTGSGVARWMGQTVATGLPDRIAGFTLRATGLNFITDMRRIAFQMEFSGHLADHADRAFAALPPPLRKMMDDRGITAADWDRLRDPRFRFTAPNGADFISPHHWLEVQDAMPRAEAEGLAMRLHMAIREQLEYAIPTASLEGRARMLGESRPGTIGGEVLRSFASYKSFTMSLMLNQYRRFAAASDWGQNRWTYAAKLSGMLLVLGATAIQLKELSKGNDPRPMDELKFWQAALFQGGGLGIFGDFFAAETGRTGGGLAETIAGPVAGLAGDLARPVASNISRAIEGDGTLLGRDAAGLVRRYTPFLSSSWYARTAYSRLVADEVQAFLDPQAEILFRRQMRRQEADYGTRPFIPRRGSPDGARLPDLSNIWSAR